MNSHRKITKAVIAAAGYGTRFLPATKNQPKEMLPIIDKPIIHYLVEEAVASGITDIILVTRAGQNIMEDYFDNHLELEYSLAGSGKEDKLEMIRNIPQMANFIYVRQRKHLPYGNGTPLLVAQNLIDDDEAFVYMFGDDMTLSNTPVTKQLIDVYEKEHPTAVIGVQDVSPEVVSRYGVVKYKEGSTNFEIEKLVEKPKIDEAPSTRAQFGRFVLTNKVLQQANAQSRGKDGELWLADMLNSLAQSGEKIIAQPIEGEWLTTGDPLNYLKTTVKFAMSREDLATDFKVFLDSI
ncbi:UTP--glucose-1-phosphate uridylyltransferase [candidate division WWE3 bacterium]|nr:UTP--glucose-1-phosphate uridylyltransferase [candidate division WWE3 bacterium]